ncbi:glycosyltransferase family 39 protein [bacterium]|nr:glycosyltransferase family 39 protein [bacterium]
MELNKVEQKYNSVINSSFLLIALFAFLWIIRLLALGADSQLDMIGVLSSDVGFYIHNARNKILFGKWLIDDFNPIFCIPLYTYFTYLSFKIFGVGFWQINLVSAVSGCLTLIFVYRIAKEITKNKKFAIIATFICGVNNIVVSYNRAGLTESLMFLFITCSLYFWLIGKHNRIYYFISALCLVCGWLSKSYGLAYILVIMGFFIYEVRMKMIKNPIRIAIWFTSGLILSFIAYLFIFVFPNYEKWKAMNGAFFSENVTYMPGLAIMNFMRFAINPGTLIIGNLTILTPLFIFCVIVYLLNRTNKPSSLKLSSIDRYSIIWIVLACLPFIITNYIPIRRFIVLVIPISMLLTSFLSKNIGDKQFLDLIKTGLISVNSKVKKIIIIFIASLAILPTIRVAILRVITLFDLVSDSSDNVNMAIQGRLDTTIIVISIICIYGLISIIDRGKEYFKIKWYLYLVLLPLISAYLMPFLSKMIAGFLSKVNIGEYPGVGPQTTAMMSVIIIGIVLIFVISKICKIIMQGNKNLMKTAFSAGIAIYLLTNVFTDVMPLIKPQYKLLEISRDLNRYFKRGTSVLGIEADTLCMETKAFSFSPWVWKDADKSMRSLQKMNVNLMERFKPEYMIMINADTKYDIYPKCIKKMKSYNLVKVKKYTLDNNVIELFKVLYNKREKKGRGAKIANGE